jgi:dTDP-4-dehydrorhamnose reductase
VKVLVTGAQGQVGSALVESAPPFVEVVGLNHEELDVVDERAVHACIENIRPAVILNAAAFTAVDRAETEHDACRRINADGPRNLAIAARAVGARLVQLSTDFVFDGSASSPYKPDAVTNPLSVYGRTKLEGENAALDILGERAVVLRTAWIYARTGTNFLRTMLRLMRESRSLRVVADQIGTPTSAHSVSEALWAIVAHPHLSGIYHWTDAGVASWYDFAVAIAELAAARRLVAQDVEVIPITTQEYPTPARRPPYSVLDKTSTVSAIGKTPVHWRRNLQYVLTETTNFV